MPGRNTRALFLAIVAMLSLTAARAAPDDMIEDSREELEANRARQAALGDKLDLLRASDLQLEGRLNLLDERIRTQQTRLAAIRSQEKAAAARLVTLEARVADASAEVEAQRELAQARIVAAYMDPGNSSLAALIGSDDIGEAEEKLVLLEQVATRDLQLIEDFDAARRRLEHEVEALRESEQALHALQAEIKATLAGLDADRAEQLEVRQALEVRIVEFEHEADALAAEEGALQSLISRRMRERTTTTSTTLAPTTTTTDGAATTSTGSTGTGSTSTTGASSTTTTLVTSTTNDNSYGLIWPVSGPVTSGFGWRWGRMHNGIDIGLPTGTPIKAAAAGEVFFSGEMGGYGKVVLIDHFNGLVTLYAHQSELGSVEGQDVAQGEVIGYVGSTGHSTGPHLHFETRVDGVPKDPMQFLP